MQTCPFGMPRKSIVLYCRGRVDAHCSYCVAGISLLLVGITFGLVFIRLIFSSAVLRSLLLDMDQSVAPTWRV